MSLCVCGQILGLLVFFPESPLWLIKQYTSALEQVAAPAPSAPSSASGGTLDAPLLSLSPAAARSDADRALFDAARASLQRIRRSNGPEIDAELNEFMQSVSASAQPPAHHTKPDAALLPVSLNATHETPPALSAAASPSAASSSGSSAGAVRWWNDRGVTRALWIGCALQLFQQTSGINVFHFHTQQLFLPAGSSQDTDALSAEQLRHALLGSLYVHIGFLCATALSAVVMDRFGRRQMLLSSAVGMALMSVCMGVAYQYHWSLNAQIAILCSVLACFALGLAPVPWLICSELFPARARALGMSLATVVNWLTSFAITASSAAIETGTGGTQWLFFIYGLSNVLAAVVTFLYVPETKNQSMAQLETLLSAPSKSSASTL